MSADGADAVEMRAALVRLRRGTGLPVAFGGLMAGGPMTGGAGSVRIGELSGAVTGALRGLAIATGNGLGGKALALSRPCAVTDYPVSRHISHEYDAAVAAEGLLSVLAVPVVVRRRVRGVLYGALRTAQPLGDRTLGEAVAAARDVEQALVVRDEARALLAAVAGAGAAGPVAGGMAGAVAGAGGPAAGSGAVAAVGSAAWEEVREAHGALRALAPRVVDPALREELLAVCGRLASATAPPRVRDVGLTPREVDVLACVATGATNAVTAERLGLRSETVKGYLRSAMRKLGAHTRLEAVVAARRAGLLP
ncbi:MULTISPECIES: helix-turn-helix transcriptional regulator [unclassified Streptomyces]|uniref:helix-turn-helix transcriptional regulator n=1 Tax=unclassified Streptomyces TaxID=2593676 RepID=UPI002E2ECCBC|nr:helix-turn-helix transcriptional regulator [Streptomyces sp. NBC_01280]WSE17981.1 helix-turn-helix transcriptional regulator [Streptomyces sp. NBC_01397]